MVDFEVEGYIVAGTPFLGRMETQKLATTR